MTCKNMGKMGLPCRCCAEWEEARDFAVFSCIPLVLFVVVMLAAYFLTRG